MTRSFPARTASVLLAGVALVLPLGAQTEVEAEAYGLTFRFPELEGFAGALQEGDQVRGSWTGTLGGDALRITFWVLGKDRFGFVEPEQVTDLIVDNLSGRPGAPEFGAFDYHPGNFGYVPYTTSVRGEIRGGTAVTAEKWIVSGILADAGYALEIDLAADADDGQVEALEAFLQEGIAYDGPLRDPEWTEEEIEARMAQDLPPSLEGERLSDPLRTEHYIVFGNSSGAKAFARQLEEYYEIIREAFPFDEVEGQRLLPVFLFRTRDQYVEFVSKKTGWPAAQAARTGGVASGDWYATTYQDPKDSTHIHELTHQIFGNRLLLRGGGSWFQEGVAVYVETLEYRQELNTVKNVGKRVGKDGVEEAEAEGSFTRFHQFFTLPSLLMSNSGQTQKGGSAAGQAYDQAGALIYFVMNDKRTREDAQRFIREVGSVRRGDLPAIERTLQRVYGVDIAEFEAMYVDFWAKAR